MEIKHLGHTAFNDIIECFLKAFENYFVKMPTDYNYYRQRWKAAKVRFDLSYGMFDNGKLVGFIINAIDKRDGEYIAFNTGTGVIPEYRGRKIVRSIYDYAIPNLIENGITKCSLEVITENNRAIKSYENIGFKIFKHYKCFNGTILTENGADIRLKEVSYKDVNWGLIPNQKYYSWDNHKNSLEHGNYKYVQVINKNEVEAFFVINPENGYLAQFEMFTETDLSWSILFKGIKTFSKIIKINNIDDRLNSKLEAVQSIGLVNSINQYEMELNIK